ncbi:MAG: hypothetical protein ABEH59_05190 [Halobacteriales archaeon]
MPRSDEWNFAESIPDILAENEHYIGANFDTFSAHHLGFCTRQLYLAQMGLRDESETQGRLQAGQLIHEFVEESLSEHAKELDVDPRMAYETSPLRFVGRPTAFDPEQRIIWHLKPRNGWYKYHPPNDRHLDQLTVYMKGLGADAGQLIYISMADLHDVRTWPPDGPMSFDPDRFDAIVDRAMAVRNRILIDGIACSPSEIPFDKCGCFLCETESVEYPEPTNTTYLGNENDQDELVDRSEETPTPKRQVIESIELPSREPQQLKSDRYHVPEDLRELELWVLWDDNKKYPLAPWQSGSMYPCDWAEDGEVDPRVCFQRAKMVAELPVEELHRQWPFPDEDLPQVVLPAVLLPHDPTDVPITVVDFDDIRNPETGEVQGIALELIDRLDSYAEVSTSGTGIHVYVRGTLPECHSPASVPLPDGGRIELYDHSRFIASTWEHVEGTPLDDLAGADELLAKIATSQV